MRAIAAPKSVKSMTVHGDRREMEGGRMLAALSVALLLTVHVARTSGDPFRSKHSPSGK